MILFGNSAHGGDIYKNNVRIDFSANINPLGASLAVKEAICKAAETVPLYPDPYCTELVRAISKYENADERVIVCSNGAAELIFSIVHAVRPKKAVIAAPAFSEYAQALGSVGCEIVYHLTLEQDGFLLTDSILGLLDGTVDIVFLCSPSNPTGRTVPHGLLVQIAERCRQTGALLFADECFGDFLDEPAAHTLKPELNANQSVFILKAFTKSFGMAGVRLGYGLCANEELRRRLSVVVQAWNVSSIAQCAGVAALSDLGHLGKARHIVKEERAYLTKALRGLGFQVFQSEVNFLLLKSSRVKNLGEKLLRHGILIRSCSNFIGLDADFFRCAVKTHAENEILVNTLGGICLEEIC